jgi:glycosyltransferase involved in cell wall biosynthesis
VKSWSDRAGVKRVIDSVEWYDRSHVQGGAWGPRALDNEISMRWRYPRYDGAIAISRYLEKHYESTGQKVLRVPPLTDVETFPTSVPSEDGPLRLLYAGTPGKKDELLTVMQAVDDVDPRGQFLRLDVLGPDMDDIAALTGAASSVPDGVTAHGRVSREQVLRKLSHADYVPLLRPARRYAQAGFPTKVVEAMASGTAVIANLTSDLDLHVRHGETGVVVSSNRRGDMAQALKFAIEGGRTMSHQLGAAARREALLSFDFRMYSGALSEFVERVHG